MHKPQCLGRNFDEILRVIDSLQLTENYQVATPVNWKEGDDCVIVPSLKEPACYKTLTWLSRSGNKSSLAIHLYPSKTYLKLQALTETPGELCMFFRLFDDESKTYAYLTADPNTEKAVLVDPVSFPVERDAIAIFSKSFV